MAQAEILRVDLLGRFRLSIGPEPLRVPTSMRGRELLALLVLEGGMPLARERVASRLWPSSSESQARTNLRREIHRLRRELPPFERAMDVEGTHLALRAGGAVASDVLEVRRALERADVLRASATPATDELVAVLSEAAQAYAGELVPECFAEWLAAERERLRHAIVAALRRLAELLEERGELGEAVRWARRLTELDPLDEISYRAQMRLHAAASDRAAALHAFHRCANLLDRELGVEPAPETRALYRALLVPGPAARDGGRPAAVVSAPAVRTSQAPQVWALVGRTAERAQLLAAWKRPGGTRVACVAGDPGIGKSRLADDVARQAERDGGTVARARAYAAEGQLSYAPVVDWLRSPGVFPRLAELDPVWRAELGRLLPELLPRGEQAAGQTVGPPGGDDAYRRRRLFEAVARALLGGAQRVVLLLDDLQWCDAETLALLHYLGRYDEAGAVLVLVTARTEELADNDAARRLLLALRQGGRLLEIELGPLDAAGVAALVRAAVGDRRQPVSPEEAERLYRISEGNPLFALEALRAELHETAAAEGEVDPAAPSDEAGELLGESPASGALLVRSPHVRAVLAARLGQLGPRAREVAQCAATIGRAFAFDVLRDASGLDESELATALDELWRRRIVREHPVLGYDFAHDALREAATRGVGPARASLLHRRVAQALEQAHADDGDAVSASLARHYELGGQSERAIVSYRREGRAEAAVYAHPRAQMLLDRGLALVAQQPAGGARDRAELELLLAQSPSLRALGGYTDRGLATVLERARALAESVQDAPALFQALRNLWGVRFVAGDMQGTLEIAGRLQELAASLPELAPEGHHALAGALTHVGKFTEAIRHFEAVRKRYDARNASKQLLVFGSDLGVFNGAWEAHALWLAGMEDRALGAAEEAVGLARRLGHAYSEALAQAYAAVLHCMRRDRLACGAAADAARELCERHGFAYYRHWGTLLAAWARADDDPAAAAAAIRDALAALDEEGAFARRPFYLAALADVLAAAGRRDEALEALDQAEARVTRSGERLWDAELTRLRAVLEPEHAITHARRALERAGRLRARPLVLRSAVTLALALRAAGDGREARDVVRQALAALPEGGRSPDRSEALRLLSALG